MIDENNYLKRRTVCKKCHNENRIKNNINSITKNKINTTPQQPKIDKINNKNVSTYENRANVVFGPRNIGKTYYIHKVLEKTDNKRPINIITRSPNQYPNCKTNDEIKPIIIYKGSVVIFDDMLRARNNSQTDEFFAKGRHEDLDVYYINQSYFALPRQTIRNSSDRLILLKQTLRDVQSMYQVIGAFNMNYDEFKEKCRVAWGEIFNYLFIDMTKTIEGKYRIFNESKNTYIECLCESEAFYSISFQNY